MIAATAPAANRRRTPRLVRWRCRESGTESAPAYPSGPTQREMEVLPLVAEGKSNPEIGDELFISPNTVANHVRNILTKTNTPGRIAAAGCAMQRGLTS